MVVPTGSKAVRMEMHLPTGPAELWTYLYNESGKAGGAYFTDVELLEDDGSPLGTKVFPLDTRGRNSPPKPQKAK